MIDYAAYRERVSKAWGPATAHPGYKAAGGSPVGQCGVTSAWLRDQLEIDHGIRAELRCGHIYTPHGSFWNHCWLDVDGVVVDLTADQFGLPPVVHGAPEGVAYVGVPCPPPINRLQVLQAALEGDGR